jgi:hypothetical protein
MAEVRTVLPQHHLQAQTGFHATPACDPSLARSQFIRFAQHHVPGAGGWRVTVGTAGRPVMVEA